MRAWRNVLTSDPTVWLRESDEPGLRLQLLTDVLGRPSADAEVRAARDELMVKGAVAKILQAQDPEGHWGRKEDFYIRSKYKGTVWNTILLGELGASSLDPRITKLADYLFEWPMRDDGGFTYLIGRDGRKKTTLTCLTANMVYALCRFGLGNDPRMDRSVGALLEPVNVTDRSSERCARCRSGDVKILKALNALPPQRRTREVKKRWEELAEKIVSTALPREGGLSPARSEWHRLSFPLMWNTDLLEMLDVLGSGGKCDERMRPALDAVLTKQDGEGRWNLEGGWNGRMLLRFDRVGKPSRWVTLKALAMLKHLPDPGQSL